MNDIKEKKQKALPAKETPYMGKNTKKKEDPQEQCDCKWGHIKNYFAETCEWTDDFNAAAIAVQIRPDARLKDIQEGKAQICWQESRAVLKALLSAAQQAMVDEYWGSKKWSINVEQILAEPNFLSEFGIGLYEKMLTSETYKRYGCKKKIKQLEELL